MFAYCRNNPVNHADPNGEWIIDAIFALQDAAEAISHPSVSSVGWVLLDVVCMVDPTDITSTAAHALKAARESEGILRVVDEGKKLIRNFDMNRTAGSYTVHFKSGMKYHGEGSLARARKSYRRISKKYGEELSHIHWTPAKSRREAFIQEYNRMKVDGGPRRGESLNYNKINSPGRWYHYQDYGHY
jgi:hypothetical protein